MRLLEYDIKGTTHTHTPCWWGQLWHYICDDLSTLHNVKAVGSVLTDLSPQCRRDVEQKNVPMLVPKPMFVAVAHLTYVMLPIHSTSHGLTNSRIINNRSSSISEAYQVHWGHHHGACRSRDHHTSPGQRHSHRPCRPHNDNRCPQAKHSGTCALDRTRFFL